MYDFIVVFRYPTPINMANKLSGSKENDVIVLWRKILQIILHLYWKVNVYLRVSNEEHWDIIFKITSSFHHGELNKRWEKPRIQDNHTRPFNIHCLLNTNTVYIEWFDMLFPYSYVKNLLFILSLLIWQSIFRGFKSQHWSIIFSSPASLTIVVLTSSDALRVN